MIDVFSPMVQPEFDPPWFDLAFDVVGTDDDADAIRVRAQGLAGSDVIGFGVEIARDGWRRIPDSDDIWFDFGRGSLFSTGEESDKFAAVLASLMGRPKGGEFVDQRDCDVVMLISDPAAISTKPCYMKFFLGPADDDEAQVFVNVDLPARRVEFREKDIEFRPSLMRHLVAV